MNPTTEGEVAGAEAPNTVKECVEKAIRAFALKQFEQAVEHYANALETITAQQEDNTLKAADLYFSYGKALLENAISQTAVFGKGLGGNEAEADDADNFGTEEGDADEDDGDVTTPNAAGSSTDLGSLAGAMVRELAEQTASSMVKVETEDIDEAEADEPGDDGEPEDDFQAAWEAFEVARSIYNIHQDEDATTKLKLADTYIALGDVSLETEKLDQAITDYTTGTKLKDDLLPLSSRQIAEAHYKLSIVLDLTSGCLADAIRHTKQALLSVEARMSDLRNILASPPETASDLGNVASEGSTNMKGKGKATVLTGEGVSGIEQLRNLPRPKIELEIKDLEELREDIALKIEELETKPPEIHQAAPALAEASLDKELSVPQPIKPLPANTVIHDLSSMVVKKKKAPAAGSSGGKGKGKRDAPEDVRDDPNAEKKLRLDDST